MNSIFIDLEFCETDRSKETGLHFEVIEFGAVKLDEKNEIISRFDALVHPTIGTISDFISELTHITNKDVEKADEFKEVMNRFLDWVGDAEYTIYSWSMSDKRQLMQECKMKECESDRSARLFENWVDFQHTFCKMLGIGQMVSLEKALLGAGVEFLGQQHSALADAENTAVLYTLSCDEESFKRKEKRIMAYMQPSKRLTTNLGSLIPDEFKSSD